MLSPLSDQKLQLQHSIRLETHLFFRKSENAQKMLQWAEIFFEGAFLFTCPSVFSYDMYYLEYLGNAWTVVICVLGTLKVLCPIRVWQNGWD